MAEREQSRLARIRYYSHWSHNSPYVLVPLGLLELLLLIPYSILWGFDPDFVLFVSFFGLLGVGAGLTNYRREWKHRYNFD